MTQGKRWMYGLIIYLAISECCWSGSLNPQMLESIAQSYCKKIQESNEFIDAINLIALENNKKLKVGSFVEYSTTVVSHDKISPKIIDKQEFLEKWKVQEIKNGQATVLISRSNSTMENKVIGTTDKIYRQNISREDPMSCFYWSYFAEKFGKEKVKFFGKSFDAFFRAQAKLGNVEPSFYYSKHVPFSVVQQIEKVEFDKKLVVTEKRIKNFAF